jgi:hypothetical protein
MTCSITGLKALVASELSEPVDPRISAVAAAIAAQYGASACAVLFYGSCLRETQIDGLMLDFYLIVSDYRAAYAQRWLAWANRLIPPNVFPFTHAGMAAKYAVLSMADFDALNRAEARTVSVWARFAQPTRLVWVADDAARTATTDAITRAAPTLLALAGPISADTDPLNIWRTGFAHTYGCELRAEKGSRSNTVVDADPVRYARFAAAILPSTPPVASDALRTATQAKWCGLRWRGKAISVARLAKASLTFAGGIDYLAWKINRHAGTAIAIKPWQRRWPLVAAIVLVPKLLARGAVK